MYKDRELEEPLKKRKEMCIMGQNQGGYYKCSSMAVEK